LLQIQDAAPNIEAARLQRNHWHLVPQLSSGKDSEISIFMQIIG
jgi:hypothetical protein